MKTRNLEKYYVGTNDKLRIVLREFCSPVPITQYCTDECSYTARSKHVLGALAATPNRHNYAERILCHFGSLFTATKLICSNRGNRSGLFATGKSCEDASSFGLDKTGLLRLDPSHWRLATLYVFLQEAQCPM